MTVYHNAEFGPKVRSIGVDERREKVERYLWLVGLCDFRNQFTYQLSGGMQQRLAIVRVLVNDPRVLLMDEPFGALDALTREKMQEELHAVWQRTGMTVLFITHSVEEAVYLGTHVVVLSARPGRVLEVLEVGFSRQTNGRDIRWIKATPDFVEEGLTDMDPIKARTKHGELTLDEMASLAPGMSELMVVIGQRFQTMYYACKEGNWLLGAYQFRGIRKLFNASRLTRPRYASAVDEFLAVYMAPIESAIQARDWDQFSEAAEAAMRASDGYHKQWGYEYIRYRVSATVSGNYRLLHSPDGM